MSSTEAVLSLTARLRTRSRIPHRIMGGSHAADLRLACFYLRRLAALMVLEEAKATADPRQRQQLTDEATSLWTGCHV